MNADDRRELVQGFASVLEDALSIEQMLEASLAGRFETDLRDTMREMGWFDLALGEEAGGLGLGVADLAPLCLVTGYHLLPTPLVYEMVALAPVAVLSGDADGALDRLRSGSGAGGGMVVPPSAAESPSMADGVVMALAPDADTGVALGPDAAMVVELASATTEVLSGTDLVSGQTRVSTVDAREVLGTGEVYRTAVVCLLADCVGAAQAALDLAVGYAKEREQFGRPIASFQAVSHLLARAKVDVELSMASLARLVQLAESDSASFDSYLASMIHSIPERARVACEHSIQVHGGAGFTWEAGIHLFYRRVLQTQAALGGTAGTASHVGRLLIDSVG
jgi:alkylation response protein AidB-like acyl-CoA dehydrogenase